MKKMTKREMKQVKGGINENAECLICPDCHFG